MYKQSIGIDQQGTIATYEIQLYKKYAYYIVLFTEWQSSVECVVHNNHKKHIHPLHRTSQCIPVNDAGKFSGPPYVKYHKISGWTVF